jgi:flagellar biogenesis protein FliO
MHLHEFIKEHHTAMTNINLTFIGANTLLGLITLSEVNLVIAIAGATVTILANADKVAYSIVRVLELKRNNWRLPNAPQKEEDTK